MKAAEIKIATPDDEHIVMLSELILCGWLTAKAEVQKEPQQC